MERIIIPSQDFEKSPASDKISNELFEIEKQIIEKRIPMDVGVATEDHINELENLRFVEFRRGSSRRPGYALAGWSLVSSVCDTLISFALVCFFMMAGSWVLQAPAREVFGFFQYSFAFVFGFFWVGMQTVYMVITRAFLGASLGEWACGLRLGSVQDRAGSFYVLRVFMRCLMVFVSGLVLLPVLSVMLGKDLAGYFSGINLVKIDFKNHV